MERVAVYRFELYDKASRVWRLQLQYATREHIEKLGGAPYLGSKLIVDSLLVTGGVYRPAGSSAS